MNKKIKTTLLGLTTAASLGVVSVAGSAAAWGPERAKFTMETPATYPVFNSITNNPTIGDERDFVRVGQINADVTDLKNEIEIVPGRQYLVYIYFHNNASSTLNSAAQNRAGVAMVTRMASSFTKVVTPEDKGVITGTITADNTNPLAVWDEAYFTTKSKKVLLSYVEGSAKIYNNWQTNGQVMPSNLFSTEGTLIGLSGLNGVIPGCEEYHGIVTYVIQADELSGSVEKTVSKDGKTFAKENKAVQPGDELTYKLTVKNTGDVALTHLVIKDSLPEGLEFVPGSVEYWANNSTVKDKLPDSLVSNGFSFNTVGTGNTMYFTYRAKVSENVACKGTELKNEATLIYDSNLASGDSVTSAATVTTICPGDPVPTPTPEPTPTPDDGLDTPESIVNTGPLEITLAVIIVLGIAAGGFYYYRTHRVLKTVEKAAKGDKTPKEK